MFTRFTERGSVWLIHSILICAICGGCASLQKGSSGTANIDDHLAERMDQNPNLLPVEAFSQLPFAENVRISPNGEWLAFLKNAGGETGLVTLNLETGVLTGIIKTDNKSMRFRWYEWASDDHILFSIVYLAGDSSVKYNKTRLFRAVPDGSEEYHVVVDAEFDNVSARLNKNERVAQFQDNVIDFLPGDPTHVLLSVDFEKPLLPTVYSLDITDGSREVVKKFKSPIRDWMTDQQGRVRVGIGINENRDKIQNS